MDKIRIGIIGSGWVVRNRHMPALANISNVNVASVWSRNPEKARQLSTDLGIPHVADHWERIIESREIDAVVIATPPVLHSVITLAALDSGKHVLCQARMARNLKEAQEMAAAARNSRLVTALYPARPGLKGDRVMRRLIQQERYVGDIHEVRLTALVGQVASEWTRDPDVVGVNAMTLGLWAEVLNRWVGPAAQVLAKAKHHGQGGSRVPNSLAVAAELACGATASYHFSECAASGPGHFVEVYGSTGALTYRFFAEEITGAAKPDAKLEPISIPPEVEVAQDTDIQFVRAIETGNPISPSFDEGLRYMEFCEAVAISAHTGAATNVPPQPTMDSWGRPLS